jgi:DNA-binding MarR family transcriptional regulator
VDRRGEAAPPEGAGPPALDRVGRAIEEWAAARPELDVSTSAVIARVSRLADLLGPAIEAAVAPHGISRGDLDVLGALRRSGPEATLALGALAARVFRTAGTMSVRVDRLAERGLVQRRPDPADGRGVLVALTATGRAVVDAALVDHLANRERLLAPLDADERARLAELLLRLLLPLEGRR